MRFLAASIALASAMFAAPLSALAAAGDEPSKEQCISENESAQSLRRRGELRAARVRLLRCVAKSCPQIVRDDCAERLIEVETAIPTLVFSAKDPSDGDLPSVSVTMDGALLVDRLDGSAVSVDPGEHLFVFTAKGFGDVKKRLVVNEGMKGRQEVITFEGGPSQPKTLAKEEPLHPPSSRNEPSNSPGGARRTVAYALGGGAIVALGLGTFFGLKSKSTYDEALAHCPKGPRSCDPTGVTGGQDANDQAAVATVMFIAGAALGVGAVVLYVTAPKSAVQVTPTATTQGVGLRIGRSW